MLKFLSSRVRNVGHDVQTTDLQAQQPIMRCDMAVYLDMNKGHISDIELGKREAAIITLQVIARGLDVTIFKLLKGL
jgi:hypothetical protein